MARLSAMRRAFEELPGGLRGALWMLFAAAAFSCMGAGIRYLSEIGLHPLMTSFFRSVFGLIILAPFFLRGGLSGLRSEHHGLLFSRGLASSVAQATYFVAITLLPLADAVSLTFTAPLFGAALAVIFLGEVFNLRRAAVTLAGFIGVLIILRPGVQTLEIASLMPLFAAFSMGVVWILVKQLSATETTERIVFFMILYTVPVGFVMALFVWQTPTWQHVPWLIGTAIVANVGQFAMTNAYRAAEATSVFPFDFARLPFTALLAYFLFAQSPDLWTWVGALVIFGASAAHMRAEAKSRDGGANT